MRWRRRATIDILAVVLLAAYGWTIQHTRAGAADPTWTAIARRGTLRVGSDPSFHPFAQERDGRWSGYDVDLVNELGKRLGLRVELKAVAYDALYDTLAAGDVDMLASALPLAPEQGWRARFSTPYLDAGQVLVVGAYSPIRGADDLAGRVVGAALGSQGDTLLRGLARQNPTITPRSEYETPEAALQALRRGELEVVVTDTVSALGLTQTDRHFRIVSPGITFEPYVLAMPIGAYQLQNNVDKTLDDLRREGFFARLNARWFARPTTNDH
jgi:polar amino acid transport system substrate-binding protein